VEEGEGRQMMKGRMGVEGRGAKKIDRDKGGRMGWMNEWGGAHTQNEQYP